MKEVYTALLDRLISAKTVQELSSLDKSVCRHYDNGTLSEAEYEKLADYIFQKTVYVDTGEISKYKTIPDKYLSK